MTSNTMTSPFFPASLSQCVSEVSKCRALWRATRWKMRAGFRLEMRTGSPSSQSRMAFDLLGTPIEFREGMKPGASIDLDGRMIESADDPAAVARREIAVLKGRRETVEGLDEVNQALDLSVGSGATAESPRTFFVFLSSAWWNAIWVVGSTCRRCRRQPLRRS